MGKPELRKFTGDVGEHANFKADCKDVMQSQTITQDIV